MKTTQELKQSFTVYQQLVEEDELKRNSYKDISERLAKESADVEKAKELRNELLKKKVLGLASEKEVKLATDGIELQEKELSKVTEEFEVISNLMKSSTYAESDIRDSFHAFMNEYYNLDVKPLEDKLRQAKEAYMTLFNEYANGLEEFEVFRRSVAGLMSDRKMNNWLLNLNRGQDIFVSPNHLQGKISGW